MPLEHLSSNFHIYCETTLNHLMESSQISEVVVEDEIRQSVRSIVLDLDVNPWEVITEQFDEEEYEQVVVVLQDMLESFETPHKIRPKCLKCLEVVAQRIIPSGSDEPSYLGSWYAVRDVVKEALVEITLATRQLKLSNRQLPYAVDLLLERLNSQTLPLRKDHIIQLLRVVVRQSQLPVQNEKEIIFMWLFNAPGQFIDEFINAYPGHDFQYIVELLLKQHDSPNTPREDQTKCLHCLKVIFRFAVSGDWVTPFLERVLMSQRPWEVVNEIVDDHSYGPLAHILLSHSLAPYKTQVKCLQAIALAMLPSPLYDQVQRLQLVVSWVLEFAVEPGEFIPKLLGDLNIEDIKNVVWILREELSKRDVLNTRTLQETLGCVASLQAVVDASSFLPDDIKPHIINSMVTQMLAAPKPWRLVAEFRTDDEFCLVVDILQQKLDLPDVSLRRRATLIKCLQTISRVSDVVPSSFILKGVKKEGEHSVFRGGFADIWQGHLDTGALVCLKVLRTFNASFYDKREDDFRALHREALIWRQLRHPRIHPFLGIVRDIFPYQLCLVSPWSENGNLCDFLEANPNRDRLKLLVEVAEGIDYLHSHDPQIIHADIRGVNVLVKHDFTCCLADFGLTMITETQAPTTSRMHSGAIRWMPPELLNNNDIDYKAVLPARDIYSFGCTIVEVFSGNVPYPYIKRDINVLTEVIVNKVTQSRPLTVRLTDRVWDVTASCLSYEFELRPPIGYVLSQLRACDEEPQAGGWLHTEQLAGLQEDLTGHDTITPCVMVDHPAMVKSLILGVNVAHLAPDKADMIMNIVSSP